MPTHIDIQCGHYRDAMHWNQKAIVADRKFYDRAGPMNFYSGYRVHNYHFAAYGAMFLGQYAPAIAAADELIETMPEAMLRIPSPPMADFFESYVVDPAARADPLRQVARDHRAGAAGGSRALLQHGGDDALRQRRRPRRARRGAGGRGRAGAVPRGRRARAGDARSCTTSPCVQAAGHRGGDAGGRDRLSPRRARRGVRPSARRRSRWRTTCPTTSRGAGCSRCATRSARCCWSRAARRRPRRCIARISAWAASCRARRSTRTMCGRCAGCSTASSARGETVEAALIRQRVDVRRRPRRPAGVGVLLLRPGQRRLSGR